MKVHPIYSTQETLQFTYDITKKLLNKVKGCYVEFGIAGGSQIGAMQQAMMDCNKLEQIYGFDSFEGIPYATSKDTEQAGIGKIDETKLGLLESTGISSHSMEAVKRNFSKWDLPMDNVTLIKGWFQNTVPITELPKIALMRLDGDLYESTVIPLRKYLPQMVKGGIIIIDDWNLEGVRVAIHEFFPKTKVKKFNEIAYINI
jgi:hypothetical protein